MEPETDAWRVEVTFTIPEDRPFPTGAVECLLADVGANGGMSDETASLDLGNGRFTVEVVVNEPDEQAAVTLARAAIVDAVRAQRLPADWSMTEVEPA